jgi:hypothetical protein
MWECRIFNPSGCKTRANLFLHSNPQIIPILMAIQPIFGVLARLWYSARLSQILRRPAHPLA